MFHRRQNYRKYYPWPPYPVVSDRKYPRHLDPVVSNRMSELPPVPVVVPLFHRTSQSLEAFLTGSPSSQLSDKLINFKELHQIWKFSEQNDPLLGKIYSEYNFKVSFFSLQFETKTRRLSGCVQCRRLPPKPGNNDLNLCMI